MITFFLIAALVVSGAVALHSTSSVGIIGGSDGPTAIYITQPAQTQAP